MGSISEDPSLQSAPFQSHSGIQDKNYNNSSEYIALWVLQWINGYGVSYGVPLRMSHHLVYLYHVVALRRTHDIFGPCQFIVF